MEYQDAAGITGEQFGADGVDQLVECAGAVCAWERTRIELANEPSLVAKKAEYTAVLEEERDLKARLARISPLPDGRSRRRKIAMCWIVSSVLVVAGFVLSLLTLEPYRLGMKAVFYCLGIAVVVPFLAEKTLELFANETLKKVMLSLACLAGLGSLILLATVRGELLAQQVRQDAAPAVIEGEEPESNAPKNTFYEDTVSLLQLVMALLAVAMEIGTGIAVHEAERMSATLDGEYESVRQELRQTQARLALLAQDVARLKSEPPIFVARFWRDFYWAMLKGTLRNAAKRFVLPLVVLALLCSPARCDQPSVDVVVAIDLSKSVDRAGPDGKTEFAKNIEAVTRLLNSLPAGTQVAVLGITSESFAQSYVILQAHLSADHGYFGERLTAGRRQIVLAWKKRSARLQPKFRRTDILGALMLASALFAEYPEARKRVLVIYSDMRQDTRDLNLGSMRSAPPTSRLRTAAKRNLIAYLDGVDVFVSGADATGLRLGQWRKLKTFWERYFERAGARLKSYSVLPDPPALQP
jgi:hypothetical protein